MGSVTWLKDSLQNLATGLGFGAKDKNVHTTFGLTLLGRPQLEAMYRSDWVARKIIDIIPFDMTREWRSWQAKENEIELLEEAEKLHQLQQKTFLAMTRARLYGGAGIYIAIKGDDPAAPLDMDRVAKDSLSYMHVLTSNQLTVADGLDRDLNSPWFGRPTFYSLNVGQIDGAQPEIKIHPSRVVPFIGAPYPDPMDGTHSNEAWGDSILQVIYDAVKNVASVAQHVASLVPEAKVDVVKVPGLSDYLATADGTERVTRRFNNAALIKSSLGMLLLEGEGEDGEQWEQKQISFEGFPPLMQMYMQLACGAADVPIQRLMGESPKGLNTNGEGTIRNYYDNCAAKQKVELRPAIDYLSDVLIMNVKGRPTKSIFYTFAPLWQLSDKEAADIGKIEAETDTAYANSHAVPSPVLAKAVRNRLIERGRYPGIEEAYEEFDVDEEAQALAAAAAGIDPVTGLPLDTFNSEGERSDENPLEPNNDNVPARRTATRDAAPRTLYVYRRLLNVSELRKWAKDQGFASVIPDLHVTLIYSREPVDWFKAYTAESKVEVNEGGPRAIEQFGQGAIVLQFASDGLQWRHDHLKRIGARSDFDEYAPHVTISYAMPEGKRPDEIEPYTGKLLFGPEYFEEIKGDGFDSKSIKEVEL